jgi:hypothetical protein
MYFATREFLQVPETNPVAPKLVNAFMYVSEIEPACGFAYRVSLEGGGLEWDHIYPRNI